MASLERVAQAIEEIRVECSDLVGAVVATPEGLVLAGSGSLVSEVSAAAASGLASLLDHHLALVRSPSCTDAIVWTPAGLWGLARLPTQHVVLAEAAQRCSAGTLRLVLARFRRDLAPALAPEPQGND